MGRRSLVLLPRQLKLTIISSSVADDVGEKFRGRNTARAWETPIYGVRRVCLTDSTEYLTFQHFGLALFESTRCLTWIAYWDDGFERWGCSLAQDCVTNCP